MKVKVEYYSTSNLRLRSVHSNLRKDYEAMKPQIKSVDLGKKCEAVIGFTQSTRKSCRPRPEIKGHLKAHKPCGTVPDPLKRSTRIQRSPEQLGGKTTPERSQSSPPILQDKSLMIRKSENSFIELGEKIGELIEMMAPTPSAPVKRTIHQPMRDLVDMLAVLHKKAAKKLGNQMPKKTVRDGTTQTERGSKVNAVKRLREEGSAATTPAKKKSGRAMG
uniref:Uncharacterized protein n=1 Tax=Glossina pallidipes TaxID=7398 RepID=A0A1A9Z285_GLOPL